MSKKQVLCHNEFTIVGRISNDISKIDNNIRVLILCPNDEDYDDLANPIYVYFDSNCFDLFNDMLGKAIAVTGHIEYENELRLVSDMYTFVK